MVQESRFSGCFAAGACIAALWSSMAVSGQAPRDGNALDSGAARISPMVAAMRRAAITAHLRALPEAGLPALRYRAVTLAVQFTFN